MKKLTLKGPMLLMIIIISLFAMAKDCIGQQSPKSSPLRSPLFDTIARLDSVLFQAFNTCDVETFTKFLTEDVEFYHDESGLMVSSKVQSDGLKTRCAEQVKNGVMRRELVKGTLEVHPLPNYGAIEIGEHNFYRTLPGQKEKLTTVAKFMNIWQRNDGEWKISRIVSYGHKAIK